MNKLKLKNSLVKNQRVLMRVDFNVPLNSDGSIADDSRIRAALPSIRKVIEEGGSLVLMSHLGRPKGKKDPALSLAPCATRLSELLGQPVALAPDCVGAEVEKMAQELKKGSLLLLENLRFHVGEEEPEREPGFVEALARLGDIYVNDAFGTAHRAHASTALIARYFPHRALMGFLIEQELDHLFPLLHEPKRPFFALIGGAKVSTKAGAIKKLLPKLDGLFVGGAMAYPFLKALHRSIGQSLCEETDVPLAQQILDKAKSLSLKVHLPADFIAVNKQGEQATYSAEIPEGWSGMDIGPKTREVWHKLLQSAHTIFWNGPMGVYEQPPFNQGTESIARTLSTCSATVVVGGGDSLAAIEHLGLQNRFTHLSTGGGASLEFLEFGHLPGIDALSNQ